MQSRVVQTYSRNIFLRKKNTTFIKKKLVVICLVASLSNSETIFQGFKFVTDFLAVVYAATCNSNKSVQIPEN